MRRMMLCVRRWNDCRKNVCIKQIDCYNVIKGRMGHPSFLDNIFTVFLLTNSVSYDKLTHGKLDVTNSGFRKGRKNVETLKDVKIGRKVRVVKVEGAGAIRRRIMDMGITKGVEISVRKVAPLGDPVEITVRGYELSLRKQDAQMIVVE